MIFILLTALQTAAAPMISLQSEPGVNDVFEMIPIAEDLWVAKVLPAPAAYAFANSLVLLGDDGILVVDTQQSPAAARALLGWIRERSDAPVRWVVNTHGHGDHVWGNQVYADAFPGVAFLAHEAARTFMLEDTEDYRAQELESLPGSIADRRRWLETGTGPNGEALTDELRARVARSLALREAYLAELRTLRPTPPNLTFTDRLTIHVGARRVELLHLGRAHTAGDIVVWFPDERLLAAGDLLEEGAPWLDGAWIPGWADALEGLVALEAQRILVSHGGLHEDAALLDWQAEFFRALVDGAARAEAEGWDDATAVERLDLYRFREAFASVGVSGAALDRYLTAAVVEARADLQAGAETNE